MVTKKPLAYRSISEVSKDLGLAQHVLRYWETQFPQLRPIKGAGGRRRYRIEDVALLRVIQYLVHDQDLPLKEARGKLRDGSAQKLMTEMLARDLAGENGKDSPMRDSHEESAPTEAPANKTAPSTPEPELSREAEATEPLDPSTLHDTEDTEGAPTDAPVDDQSETSTTIEIGEEPEPDSVTEETSVTEDGPIEDAIEEIAPPSPSEPPSRQTQEHTPGLVTLVADPLRLRQAHPEAVRRWASSIENALKRRQG